MQIQQKPTIALVKVTNLVTNGELIDFAMAMQVTLDRDFEPVWGFGANIVTVAAGQAIPPGAYPCYFLDDSDQADALGYHDVTPEGLPVMKIFVHSDILDGLNWSVTASHEIFECLVDQDITQVVIATDAQGVVRGFAKEVADAPEDDQFAYHVGGILISAWVTPTWFDTAGKAPYTFPVIKEIDAPFKLAPGGYIGFYEVAPNPTSWTQRFAQGARGKRTFKKDTSRTKRRFLANP